MSPERSAWIRKKRKKDISVRVARIMILVIFFGAWEFTARVGIIDPFIMSSPSRVMASIYRMAKDGQLFYHISITCMETAAGFILGTVLGVIIATALWWSDSLSRVLEPYLVVLNSLPKIALGPVFIVWLGPGVLSIVVMGLAISLVVTILEVHHGMSRTDGDKIKLVQSFGGNRWQVLTKVVLPSNLPTMMSALKVNVGLSWVGVIVGEYLVSKAGIGYLIVYGGQVFQLDLVMAGVLILGVLAGLMYLLVSYLEKILIGGYE